MIFECGPDSARQYAPPVAGNGDLSILVDFQGAQCQQPYHKIFPAIWWAGRRYDTACRELVPFGHFEQEIQLDGKILPVPSDWRQRLDTREACIQSTCQYEGGLTIRSEVMVHAGRNLIMIRKQVLSPTDLTYQFRYVLAQPGQACTPPRRMTYQACPDRADGSIEISYQIDGQQQYHGMITLFADRPLQPEIQDNCFTLSGVIPANGANQAGYAITFCLLFQDDLDGQDYLADSRQLKQKVRQEGFDHLRGEHRDFWQAYWSESTVQIPDEAILRSYESSQYHLRCATTRWSIPIAIADSHWQCRYFGFDEFFGFMGLLTSNHLNLARRVPEFRYQGLDRAVQRASRYFKDSNFRGGARYPWETVETGEEASPPGFWYDHIFHMAHIALETWYFYLFTADQDFLRTKGYPVIKACAEFFFCQAVYEIGEQTIIGKCTDLERLGPGVQNAYMTTCSAIATLEAASAAAGILGLDSETAGQWQETACRLKAALPHDGEKYIPYPGCDQKSVAVLSGLFPYAAIDAADIRQKRAIADYCDAGAAFGNMYPVGQSVCAWYAAWKSVIYARLQDSAGALAAIRQGAAGSGCFAELFEINEPTIAIKPWFSTAEGTYIQGLNEMLVQSAADTIWIAPAIPSEWQDFSFRLNCRQGRVIAVRVTRGQIVQMMLRDKPGAASAQLTLVIPAAICPARLTTADFVTSTSMRGNFRQLELDLTRLAVRATDGDFVII